MAVPERAWITKVEESGGKFTISGRALDNQTVADFMRDLEASDYFENVDLIETSQKYLLTRTGEVSDNQGDSRRERSDGKSAPGLPDKWVRIKEFMIDAQVNYAGKLLLAGDVNQPAGKEGGAPPEGLAPPKEG
jgi:hypothetical protein